MSSPDTPANQTSPVPHTESRKQAGAQLAELDVRLAEVLPKQNLDELVSLTSGLLRIGADAEAEHEHPISPLTGRPTVGARQVVVAQRANLLRGFAIRRRVLEGALTSGEVTEMLGSASRQTARDRAAAGTLLAIKEAGRTVFPIWQFDPEGPDGVVEGLPEVARELGPGTQLARILWFMEPKRALGGRTPIEALRARDIDDVLAEARSRHAA